ncbi:MAG: DUF1552 domain-containing protein [Myxococcales bacterium]
MSIAHIKDRNVTFDEKALRAARQGSAAPLATSRRTILRGAAASIALPALDSLLRPGRARAQAKPLVRFVTWHIGCGVWAPSWYPTAFGTAYALTPSLMSLANVKSKVLVLSGIQNTPACNPTGSHGCGPPAMTTCRQGTKPAIGMGISVDQVYAQALGSVTRIPSLQLTVTDKTFADVSYPAVYNGTTSWANATTPLAPVVNPGVIFDRLFTGTVTTGNSAAAAEAAKRKALRTSVLDFVSGEATSLQPKLGTTDRHKLDQYLTSIRAVETEVQRTTVTPANCGPGALTRPTIAKANTAADVPALTKLMLDLMVLAFQCDATRVISFMQGNGGNTSFAGCPWLSITEDHHGLSHHQGDAARGAKLAKIDQWEVSQYAYFLEKLNAIDEGGTTMLDNSLVFLSSEITDGNAHNQKNKPILVGGTAGGKLLTGRHTNLPDASQADMFIAFLNLLGVPATTFGLAGTKPLTGLT